MAERRAAWWRVALAASAIAAGVGCGSGGSGNADSGAGGDAGDDADAGGSIDAPGGDATEVADAGGDSDAGGNPATLERLFAVTITDPWVADTTPVELTQRLDGLVGAGGRLPTARVVFDEGVDQVFMTYGIDASAYVEVVQNIGAHARVMGELLDSFYVGDYSATQYRARACEYRATLGHLVDIWEIGNEVNGEWLGSQLIAKLQTATEVFTADTAGFATLCPGFALQAAEKPFDIALTLYYNGTYNGGVASSDNCWELPDNAMLQWASTNFATPGAVGTEAIAPHLDYVLVSYYEDDCEGIQPEWQAVFDSLGEVFTDAKLGIGECGTTSAAQKVAYAERYYAGMDSSAPAMANMAVDHPRFVGGYFWWYFSDDMTNEAFFTVLQDALASPFWNP